MIKIRTLWSFLLATGIIGASFFHVPSVLAAGCVDAPGVSSFCKDDCGADEIDGITYVGFYQISGCKNAEKCCIGKGDALCNVVGQAAKTNKNKATNPTAEVPVYACKTSCAGGEASDFSSLLCPNNATCCAGGSGGGDGTTQGSSAVLENPLGKGATVFTILNRIASVFLGMVGALALGVFVIAGVMWITAGTSKRVSTAQDMIKYAILGLALILFSYTLTQIFFNTILTSSDSSSDADYQCTAYGQGYSCTTFTGDTPGDVIKQQVGFTCVPNLCPAADFHTQCCKH